MDEKTYEYMHKRTSQYKQLEGRKNVLEGIKRTLSLCINQDDTHMVIDCGVNYSDGRNRIYNKDDVIVIATEMFFQCDKQIEKLSRLQEEI